LLARKMAWPAQLGCHAMAPDCGTRAKPRVSAASETLAAGPNGKALPPKASRAPHCARRRAEQPRAGRQDEKRWRQESQHAGMVSVSSQG
ncbi:MAG TPA: hypothetical protein VF171_06910, partial [Trueperaceae bacterium]